MSAPVDDPWAKLRAATPARVGQGRTGAAQRTQTTLEFQFAHARARDAIHRPLDLDRLTAALAPHEVITVASAAPDRPTFLRRPDLGRQLADRAWPALDVGTPPDVVFVIADGLSADAVQNHAAGVVHAALPALAPLVVGPIVLAAQARVAIGDAIAHRMGARLVVLLVGERPGLTVADSLGAYLTYAPAPGCRDSARNCISNIHDQGGLSHTAAAHKITWLVHEALKLKLTGTGLKENAGPALAADEGFGRIGQGS